ncbi:biotin--[acetyl-CoA-carboxylase] ligase [Candidatus Phycosocius spiralis]|uniref:biotin--[biotin carboxyl-carrier protein] ligase n=1 Tax=Candidatus Phycosocius spiralis TaxID=2815099 RepID=A0ABQ4PSX0_9PROT|nr:biotin--[acetyl-CoA-carboxylase] ligase [Candidatus Phycosocius spiralis]
MARLYDSLDSTNDEARRLSEQGETGPLWLRSLKQTKGRGRRGRTWYSEPGNLFATGLITLECSPAEAANLSFVAALAVAEAIDHHVPQNLVSLKWPNDVLIEGRKTSGILLESWQGANGFHIAIGIGVNVLTYPHAMDQQITCVARHLLNGQPTVTVEILFEALRRHFQTWFDVWVEAGFAPIAQAWLTRATGVGQPIMVRLQHETLEGRFLGLSMTGALQLEQRDGTIADVAAGDVFFT